MEGFQIVVLDKGFVYVGKVHRSGDLIYVENAKNIRSWGTTSGLGELARGGPTPKTVLDFTGTVVAPFHAVVHLITTDPAKWPGNP